MNTNFLYRIPLEEAVYEVMGAERVFLSLQDGFLPEPTDKKALLHRMIDYQEAPGRQELRLRWVNETDVILEFDS